MKFAKDAKGLPIDAINEQLDGDDAEVADLDRITDEIKKDVNPHRVVIDCTSSQEVAEYYEQWMSLGVDVISPSRNIPAGPLQVYKHLCQVQKENCANWLRESTVGSALPILGTLRDLVETGDKVQKIRGSVSATMAYILSTFNEEIPFSEALAQAVDKEFAEADIREDLTGSDTAKKIVILARTLGMDVELEDVEVESFLTEELASNENLKVEDVKVIDDIMLEKFKKAQAEDRLLRYKFEIVRETGKCRCFLDAVDKTDPLYRLTNIENLVAFETDRYKASPLIVKGAAGGPQLAASGKTYSTC